MLLVYCEHITPRVEYIFRFVLHTVCGFHFTITSDEEAYIQHTGATLNYSHKNLRKNDFKIHPNGLLAHHTIVPCEAIIKQDSREVKLFLKAEGVDSSCPDPFAAAFYLLTRYEEYLNFTPDAYNRFEANASVLYKNGLLHRPLVNEWAEALKQIFSKAHASFPSRPPRFSCKMTIDVDQAFAFRHRGIRKNVLALTKNTTQQNTSFLESQLQTILFGATDPYDSFDYLSAVQQALGMQAIYFINVGAPAKWDKNLPLSNGAFRNLLNKIKTYAEVGLHPSYFSDIKPGKLQHEKEALEYAMQQPVTKSRQHYLKLRFPQTYRQLLSAGITEDYTMGYASHPGFRAGTCTPFYWFDLMKDEPTTLRIFPITYMEGSFGEDLAMHPEAALAEMKKLTDTVRFYNGCLISIWHNHTVNDRFFWKGWKAVFEQSLHYIVEP